MSDKCEKCGQPIEPGDVKCPACGTEVSPPVLEQPNSGLALLAVFLPLLALVVVIACLGGIVFAAVMFSRVQASKSAAQAAQVSPPPIVAPQQMLPKDPVPPTPPPMPPMPPMVKVTPPAVPVPAPAMVNAPEPTLTDFVPSIQSPGKPLVLRGSGLAMVNKVLFISSHGATSVPGKIIYAVEHEVIVTVPEVSFADYGIIIAVFSPGGVSILADQHTGATPWGTDGHLHDTVVSVQPGDEISTRDGMVILAKPGSDISVTDNCVVFMHEDVKLRRHGKGCQIYAVAPELRLGVTVIKALNVNFDNDAFRVKPASGNEDQ